MTVEIILYSISTKVWDQAGIELATSEFLCVNNDDYGMTVGLVLPL